MTNHPIRIGTRNSELATWQARKVAEKLAQAGYKSELIYITSKGDKDQKTPLPEMGGQGVFTKAVDRALLNNDIDLAVHSYKDLPTYNPLPLTIAAVIKRGDPRDSLVAPDGLNFLDTPADKAIIATGSNRRKAQWLNRYPSHQVVNLRGNVNTRLQKVENKDWNGAIFAAAGLLRIDLGHNITQYLDWMIPAPAQGAIAVMVRDDDNKMQTAVSALNHKPTALCTAAERNFLSAMGVGCSAPVGAYAKIEGNQLHFKAVALSVNGQKRFDFEKTTAIPKDDQLGEQAARQMLENGADEVIDEVKNSQ